MQIAALRAKLPYISVAVMAALLVLALIAGFDNYALVCAALVVLSIAPFFIAFENRRPRARDMVPLAVMAAIAIASRAAFAPIPQFKPIVAIVIISGLSFGAQAGFLTGSIAMLASNFIFGQGPWTPWQMFACGMIGFLAGFARAHGKLTAKWSVCLFGLLSGFLYGLIVDMWTVIGFLNPITLEGILAKYALGLPFNAVLAVATAFFLFLLERPMDRKLARVRDKFGLLRG